MNQTGFAVSQFENRNGITSWRVAGWLHGVRIRKNFKTKEEAAAEKAALELNALQAASGLRATATSLSNEQIREAEAVFRRLEGRTQSLGFCVDFALTNYRDPIRDISVADATKDYVSLREADFNQGNLSKRQFTSYRCELRALEIWFADSGDAGIATISLHRLERGDHSSNGERDGFGAIRAFRKRRIFAGRGALNHPIHGRQHSRRLGGFPGSKWSRGQRVGVKPIADGLDAKEPNACEERLSAKRPKDHSSNSLRCSEDTILIFRTSRKSIF